jgi:HK97 gp10 family phage protein
MDELRIEGLAELQAKFRQLSTATKKSTLRRVGMKVLKPIADRARVLAPRLSGSLKRSIKVSTRLSRRQYLLERAKGDDVNVFAGAGALPQATLQEFGTSELPAQPFMRPAWDAGKDQLLTDVKNELWSEIQKAVSRDI